MSGARVLLVEDNSDLAEGLRYNLEREGYTVKVAADGPTGLEAETARSSTGVSPAAGLPLL